jgi:DNA polymerase-3 subunit delta'
VPILPLLGHSTLRARLTRAIGRKTLAPAILLQGSAGVGKQRLALSLADTILCDSAGEDGPCGSCESCRFTSSFTHPDLHWYFPRPRPKNADPSLHEIQLEYAASIAERVSQGLLYPPSTGSDGLFVATVRAIVKEAALSPALAKRKVFVVGNADRMVSQEGADQAANAFLKLLEEPPANTTIILTSDEPGALLPTIRSRLVCYRVNKLSEANMREFIEHPVLKGQAGEELRRLQADEMAMNTFIAEGAPGALFAAEASRATYDSARAFVAAAASAKKSEMIKASFALGVSGARGNFMDFLGAVSVLVHDRTRSNVLEGDLSRVAASTAAIFEAERMRQFAMGNLTPQLLGITLMRAIARVTL